jgi:translation initiation factor IF-2
MNQQTKTIENLISRPPIVVVLGHVDHGKTTLLDYIRKTKVAEKEAGGITQHIGAYEVEVLPKAEPKSRESEANRGISSGKSEKILRPIQDDFASFRRKITFLDTPGHEAFSNIRSRGAKAADVALLVVAADEGIKPQTRESLNCIKEAKIPFIVVLTKIDKEGANPEKVKKDLLEIGVYLEGWGGDVPLAEVSSKTGKGIDELLELILLVAEMEELKANPHQPASGIVIESHLDSRRGITATLIITNGTLHLKDKIVAGSAQGKVKILEDFQGKIIGEVTFSSPIRVIGFEALPSAGEEFFAGEEESKKTGTEASSRILAKELGDKNSALKIPVIIKSDTFSSSEALESIITQLGQEKGWLFLILKNEVGDLSEGDLKIIPQERTLIISFRINKKPEISSIFLTNKNLIPLEGEIIYEIKDKIQKIIENQFINKPTEEILGKLEALTIFHPEKGNQLIGGKVIEGLARNKVKVRILRNKEIIGEGRIVNLQKNRVDVNEVAAGGECGILIDCSKLIEKGDLLEFFQKI